MINSFLEKNSIWIKKKKKTDIGFSELLHPNFKLVTNFSESRSKSRQKKVVKTQDFVHKTVQ